MVTSYSVFVPALMGSGSSKRIGINLRAKGHKKAFVIYDKGMWDFGIAQPIIENLNMAGIKTECFDGVSPDPPDEMVEEAAEIARKAKCDVIVGIGGGSSMDTAKGVNVLINNEPPIRKYFGIQNNLKPGLPMVFIPTTAGTGSEVTNMTVISCVSENRKDSVLSPVCTASLAILDPDLTVSLPPGVTAATGIDAFAHAVESLTSGQANPMSDAMAQVAIRDIFKWLPVAIEDGKNIEARQRMLEASMFAGMAFTNALVHLGHCLGHAFGAQFDIPHGNACAVCLPEVIEWTARSESRKVRMICDCMGVSVPEDASWQETGALAKDTIRAFLKKVNMPANIKQLGISLEDAKKIVPLVNADTGLALCPYRITRSGIEKMIESAYNA